MDCRKPRRASASAVPQTSANLFAEEMIEGSSRSQSLKDKGLDSGKNLIATKIFNFDHFIGGGFPIGSMTLIEQDEFGVYTSIFLKCLMSNQLYSQIRTDYVSKDAYPSSQELIEKLPKRKEISLSKLQSGDMKIAWRYKNLPNLQSISASGQHFDLGTPIDKQECNQHQMMDNIFLITANTVQQVIDYVTNTNDANRCRVIVIDNFRTLLLKESDACSDLYALKSLIRNYPNITLFVPINSNFWPRSVRNQMVNIADAAIQFEALNTETNIYKDFSAIIKIHKMPKLNSLNYTTNAETLDIGIEMLKHNHFILVQQLSLPPDDSATASRSSSSCSTVKADF